MTQSMDGLVAPEGTYMLTASYVLPPQPAFMTSMQPQSGGMTAIGAGQNATTAGATASALTAGTSAQGTSPGTAQGQAGSHGTSGTTSNAIADGNNAGRANATTGDEGAEAGFPSWATSSSEMGQLKTALHHISMQAPSAWSHIPVLPPSKISVATVRPLQSTGGLASGSSISRKERQQQSQTSTAAQGLTAPPIDSSVDGSSGSSSDLGGEMSGSDNKLAPLGGALGAASVSKAVEPSRPHWGPVLEATLASQGIDGTASHVTGGAGGLPGMAALQLLSHLGTTGGSSNEAGASNKFMQSSTTALPGAQASKNMLKPRNNIKQTSSSFVQRLQTHADLAKLLASRADGMSIERHAFISRGRMLFWVAEVGSGWIRDPLARLTFASPITSHDVNQHTRASNRLDVIIGFSSSDLVWLEAISMRYSRLNKAGCVNDAPITTVRWLPGSESIFLASHSDGTCTMFDITREDSSTGSWTPVSGMSINTSSSRTSEQEEEQEVLMAGEVGRQSDDWNDAGSDAAPSQAFRSWNPHRGILITRPTATDNETTRKTWSKLNPVAHWRIARSVSITDMAFSPDHSKLALVATDGLLRLVNLLTESLQGTFQSYYGAVNRVVWSPDAKFLLTAGCDDLISVWTSDGRLLSRCPGHSSFVTGLVFDPWKWRVEDRTYRFVSVGEDGKVFLWDFSSAALHRPRLPHSAHSNRRTASVQASTASLLHDHHGRRNSGGGAIGMRRGSALQDEQHDGMPGQPVFQPAKARGEVAELQPVASYQVGPIPGATSTEVSTSNVVPFAALTSTSSTGGETGAEGTASSVTNASANGAANGSANGATAGAAGQGGSNTASGGAGGVTGSGNVNLANEPGSAPDLLVDVRCRPDGIVLLHKSGAMRYLLRPTSQPGTQER